MRLRRNITRALAIAALLVGCARGAEPEKQAKNSPQPPKSAKTADLSFAFDYFHRTVEKLDSTSNFVFSPISAERIGGILALGAQNKTKRELIDAFRRVESDDEWAEEASKLSQTLRVAPETTTFDGFWIQKDFARPQTEFWARLLSASLVDEISLEDFSDSESMRTTINRKIAEKTADRIPEFFDENEFRSDWRVVVADVVAFDGKWADPFDPEDTKERPFVDANGRETPTPQMLKIGDFRVSKTDNMRCVEIPYELSKDSQKSRFSFFACLPCAEDADYLEFEKSLTADQFLKAIETTEAAKARKIELQVPKFSVETEFDLTATLKEMGAVEAFGDAAEFESLDGDGSLKLDSISQGVSLSLDEEGTRAAAATVATFVSKSMPGRFVLDRPFVYAIRENSTGALLFLGRFVAVDSSSATAATESEPEPVEAEAAKPDETEAEADEKPVEPAETAPDAEAKPDEKPVEPAETAPDKKTPAKASPDKKRDKSSHEDEFENDPDSLFDEKSEVAEL